ncbi:unnamed protein product [Cyclocybe aegerita]|uniref:ER-bound oxygenase mpaB/mpaB'/Rubber oxygenase catalytic domain-containing protein n=1 Tax=Cyclocybe aegerita TaxID=1973307 RepID=A0A8S0W5E4_CYCAE|nr:unnamed protein product [Cyclocybe aegerita]
MAEARYIAPPIVVVGVLLLWLVLVRSLRWRRYNAIHSKYGPKWNNGQGIITPEEAQKIIHVAGLYDMPLLMNVALAFALFKTYGIPTISKLLAATKQLKSKETISRRYTDTEILIATWVSCPISGFLDLQASKEISEKGADAKPADDPRAMIALARVNYLHSRYKISNDDYLYTLSLFILEPMVWADRYAWRRLSPLEKEAGFIYWKEIGKRMGIREIPETIPELSAWSKKYEEMYMVPAQTNRDIGDTTVDELLAAVPNVLGLKSLGRRIAICLMDDIVRESMMYEKQHAYLSWLVDAMLKTTAFVQRWLMLPAFSPRSVVALDPKPKRTKEGECPRLHPEKFAARPWYRPQPTGLGYLRDKLLVAAGWFTEMPGPHLKSEGYRLEELGPLKFEDRAHEEVMKSAAELQGCPVAGPWSLEGRREKC